MSHRHSAFIIILIAFFAVFYILSASMHFAIGTSTATNANATLNAYDQTDSEGGSVTVYTSNTTAILQGDCDGIWDKKSVNSNPYFYANFTNSTDKQIITNGNCTIRFNATGTYTAWINMSYNTTAKLYIYQTNFTYKGVRDWQVSCISDNYGSLNITDNITITNSAPNIFCRIGGPNGYLPATNCTEDVSCYYNFSANVSDDDANDVLTYTATSTFSGFSLNGSNGSVIINIMNDSSVGAFNVTLTVTDTGALVTSVSKVFNVTPVNDAPLFTNVNTTMNVTQDINFYLRVNATDEENNIPFFYNVSFINCATANWSTRDSTNCTLFSINYTTGVINFTPSNDDVGNYTINFTVTDAGNLTQQPVNATNSTIVLFTVINVNEKPNLTYVCDNERNTAENSNFTCWVTANDTDEASNLTFISNTTWFTFNNSQMRFTENITSNTTAQINFTANDSAVGVWYINITVNDTSGGMDSIVINFNVSNVNDTVALGQLNNSCDIYAGAEFYLDINASDDDLRIPLQGRNCSSGCYNESLTFTGNITGRNTTLFTIGRNTTAKNTTTAYIRFTPSNNDSGNYTINITVRDANNWSITSAVFNLTIYNNTAPYWVDLAATSFDAYDNSTFSLDLNTNATDAEGDAITFSDNTTVFDINSSGYISFFANDSKVGTHNVTITLTDARGAANSTRSFIFTVHNINETPVLSSIPTPQNATEDSPFPLNFSANDEDLDLTFNYLASDFYSDNLVWSLNSTTVWFNGANATTKLNFTRIDNRSASISFTPNKTDVGSHVINITVNDSTGRMDSQEFTITVTGINHAPVLDPIGPRNITVNQTFYLDINATDLEDGADNITGNNNFTFASNETWFNLTNNKTGIINITFTNNSYVGYHWINISVNDSTNSSDSEAEPVLRIAIYAINVAPTVEKFAPTNLLDVNTAENSSKLFQVIVTDDNAKAPNSDTLNITWKIDGETNSTSNIENGSSPSWTYYPNFTAETINSTAHNITAWVYDSQNNFTVVSWNVTVNHTNAPVYFSGTISNISDSYTSYVNVTCDFSSSSGMCEYTGGGTPFTGGYFSDVDHSDSRYNASINLTLKRMESDCSTIKNTSGMSLNINNDTLKVSFYYSTVGNVVECFNITAIDATNSTYNATSNRFIVNLTVTAPPAPTPIAGGGGGGGSTKKTPVALKIIVPEPFSMFTHDRIVVPIKIQNRGQTDLNKIRISSFSTLEGIKTELEKNFYESLPVGKEEKFDMTIITDTNTSGSYEVIINASVESPVYSDSASFFVNLIEIGWKEKVKAQEKIVFLEELLIGNPECLELTEILNEAKKAFEEQDYKKSLELSESAIQACKYAVSSKGRAIEVKRKFDFGTFAIMLTLFLLAFLFILFVYHSYKRGKFRKSTE